MDDSVQGPRPVFIFPEEHMAILCSSSRVEVTNSIYSRYCDKVIFVCTRTLLSIAEEFFPSVKCVRTFCCFWQFLSHCDCRAAFSPKRLKTLRSAAGQRGWVDVNMCLWLQLPWSLCCLYISVLVSLVRIYSAVKVAVCAVVKCKPVTFTPYIILLLFHL